nr:hypothetical protein [Tanacetum cinerariifolium]
IGGDVVTVVMMVDMVAVAGDDGGVKVMLGWRWSGAAVVDGGGGSGVKWRLWWGYRGGATREGEWCRGSVRSGSGESFWVPRKRSPEKFSGGGGWWPEVVVAGGGRPTVGREED